MTVSAGRSAYLGIDLGTSGLKLTLVGSDGTVIGEAEATYGGVHTPRPGHAETDPAEWAGALDEARNVFFGSLPAAGEPPRVASIGVTGQMHGVVLVGHDGNPVRPAVLWPDQRASSSLDGWRALPEAVRERLGNPLVAGMAGPILSWLREHEPASLAATEVVMSPKDWLRRTLTFDRTTERSDASATLLWDVVADAWSTEALQLAGVGVEQLPRVVPSDDVVGTTAVTVPGWSGDVPVVAGGADTACALVAVTAAAASAAGPQGLDVADVLIVNVGTGIQVLRPVATAPVSPSPVTHRYADTESGWYEMLAIQTGGLALSWVQAQLRAGWDELVGLAAAAPPGSSGAVFVPFLTGERGGVASTSSTASWQGLTASVGRAELARSAFEGLAFTIRRGIDLLGRQVGPVLLCGGGSREPWVRQLIADVVGLPMRHIQLRSASAIGAAALAARGIGDRLAVPAAVTELIPAPDDALASAYERWLGAIR